MEICDREEKQEEDDDKTKSGEERGGEDKSMEDIQSQEGGRRVGETHEGRNGKSVEEKHRGNVCNT